MILSITFSNFYSYKSPTRIDFTAHRQKTNDYYTYTDKKGDSYQVTKIATFIGGNASGKTNIMRLFSFLGHFIGRSENIITTKLPYKTFFNNNQDTSIEVEFELENEKYIYTLILNENLVKNESLYLTNKKHPIFKRNKKINLNKSIFEGVEANSLARIREDMSLITFLRTQFHIELIEKIYNYFASFNTNINEKGVIHQASYQLNTIRSYYQDKEFKKKVEKLLTDFNIGVKGFDINQLQNENENMLTINFRHQTEDGPQMLNFAYESSGTHNLFFNLGKIVRGLANESLIILDEIEFGLHPEAVSKILSYFLDMNVNRKAQLVFTTHSYDFLNNLDMHQINLVDKKLNSESTCVRLNTIKGARPDENFVKKYMSGSYGAFPNIRI